MRGGVCVAERADEATGVVPSLIALQARQRQAAVLFAADQLAQRKQKARGEKPSRTRLAADVGMGYDQYARYVNGETPLRFDQVGLFATVYGIDPDVLGRAILAGDAQAIEQLAQPAEPYDMAADLRGHIPEADIPGFVAEHAAEPVVEQQAAARGIKRLADEARKKAMSSRKRNRPA